MIDHGRRRVLHFNVTESPTACWVIQQLRDGFPNEPAHRFLIFGNDAVFSAQVAGSIQGLGLTPKRTTFQSPWQNGTAERFVGRRLLCEYVDYYNAERVQTSIGEVPDGRKSETRP